VSEIDKREIERILNEELLPSVERPAQYIGGEYNSVCKDWESADVRMAFLFPDTYELGMSHMGMRILYEAAAVTDGVLLERSFAPLADMEAKMRALGLPLFTWETHHAVKDFDVIGFTLQYEMSYTNILNMLDLSGLKVLASERDEYAPLVIAGGPCAFNPEPLADFIDLFVIGDGEEMNIELLQCVARVKKAGGKKADILREAMKIEGVYIPSFYDVSYNDDGTVADIKAQNGAPAVVKRRIVKDMDKAVFPTKCILPNIKAVHDRMMLEIMRGCTRGCRFCQAGIIYRPTRERSPELLLQQAIDMEKNTGYDELGLLSLSSADYNNIAWLTDALNENLNPSGVSLSLPSLRIDAFSLSLAEKVQKVRKSGLTFAPEAGSQKMRNVINKGINEDEIIRTVAAAVARGWTSVKLYFMIGLPFETDEDIIAIAELCRKVLREAKGAKPDYVTKPISISLGVSTFVPKCNTPFQWCGQIPKEEIRRRQMLLRDHIKPIRGLKLSCHDSATSYLEAAFATGDRRLGKALYLAWQKGCKFDGWTEHFRFDLWQEAFSESGLSLEWYANRERSLDEVLPWSHISCGVSQKWLKNEWKKAGEEALTLDCRNNGCNGCGVCQSLGCDNDFKAKLPLKDEI